MYNKKVLSQALANLQKRKADLSKPKDIIVDPMGQYNHPGEITRIPSNDITMDNVPYPVYADPNVGPSRMMYPEQEYNFPGADYVDEYPQMKSGGNKLNHVVVKQSKIPGANKGLFSNQSFRKGQLIGLAHSNGQPVGKIGNMHNHSDQPNMYSVKHGNERYVYAKRDIQPGEELTTNYRLQPELEQPEDFMRKGGSTPKLPNKKNSRAYSRSLDATNRLFAEHPWFKKTKSRKNKIYDPNAKYYQEGGAASPEEWEQEIRAVERQIGNPADWTMDDYYLLQDKLNAYRNWRETTPEGQAVVDYHNEEGEYDVPLPEHLQDYTNAMMKARLAYADMHGNPSAQRMVTPTDKPYIFTGEEPYTTPDMKGEYGTHYMFSDDNYAVPTIQQGPNGLFYNVNANSADNEAIRFDRPKDAEYFAKNYKQVSPAFMELDLTEEEIEQYKKGGFIIEELPQAQSGKNVRYTDNPNDPGEITRIPSNDITMEDVPYPVMAYPNIGQPQMMYPEQNYNFPDADYVDEVPMAKYGGLVTGLRNTSGNLLMNNKGKRLMAESGSLSATNKLILGNPLVTKRKNAVFVPGREFQVGGQKATVADSINVYKRALEFESKLKELGYKNIAHMDANDMYITGFGTESLQPSSYVKQNAIHPLRESTKGWELNPETDKTGTSLFKESDSFKIGKGHMYLEKKAPYQYEGNELLSYIGLNTDLPKVFYDSRIKPQKIEQYQHPKDVANFFKYDPLAVKPSSWLSDAQFIERFKKYGSTGLQESRIKSLGLSNSGASSDTILPNNSKALIKREPNLNTDLTAWLKSQNAPASFTDRKKLYEQATGLTDYKGTAEQNIGLLNLLKDKGLTHTASKEEQQAKKEQIVQLENAKVQEELQAESQLENEKDKIIKLETEKNKDVYAYRTQWVRGTDGKLTPKRVVYSVQPGGKGKYIPIENAEPGYKKEQAIELELTDEEIEQYRKGGYIVEELPKAQSGLTQTTPTSLSFQRQAAELQKLREFEKEKEKVKKEGVDKIPDVLTLEQKKKLQAQINQEKESLRLVPKKVTPSETTNVQGRDLSIEAKNRQQQHQQDLAMRQLMVDAGGNPEKARALMVQRAINTDERKQEQAEKAYEQSILDRITSPSGGLETGRAEATDEFWQAFIGAGLLNRGLKTAGSEAMRLMGKDVLLPGANLGNLATAYGAVYSPYNIYEGAKDISQGNYVDGSLQLAEGVLDAYIPGSRKLMIDGAQQAGKYLTTQTPLKDAYKLNPRALKENPEMFLYRARPIGQNPDINMAAQLRAKEAAGEPLTWYQRNLLNPQTNPQMLAREKYYGQWFEKDPSRLDFYINPGTRNFADNDAIEILRTKLPKSEADKLNVSRFDDAKVLSASPETEFILPKQMIESAEKFPDKSLQQLIQEDKAFNTPHWLRGYGSNTPKQLPGSSVASSVDDVGKGLNLSRTSSKPKSAMFNKTEDLSDETFKIKKRFKGRSEEAKTIPKSIDIEGKSGNWQLNRNDNGTFSFSASMTNPVESGRAMLKMDKLMPPKPTILEQKSYSLDSWLNHAKLKDRPHWSGEFDGYIPLNHSAIHNKSLSKFVPEATTEFSVFKNQADAEEALQIVNSIIKKQGITQEAKILKTGDSYQIQVPNFKLTRDYKYGGMITSPAVIIGAATGAATQEYKRGGEIELELTPEEIQYYKQLGYTVEEI